MARTEKRLDPFTAAYVEAMLWSTTDESDEGGGEPLDKNYSASDIAPETMELIVEDCADFQERYGDLLSESGIDDSQAGHDFWLSREGHGSGFFDEDTIDEEFQEPLQEAAQSYGSFYLTVDEDTDGDMVIYGPPPDWYRSHHHRGNVERLTGKPANPPAQESRRPVARALRRQVRDAKREADAGFAVDVYPQELVEENAHDRFNEDPEFRKKATKAGLLEIRSGDITLAGWAKLNADIRQIEGNALAWLHEKFTNVRDEGHGTHGDLIGTFWFDPTDPEQAHLVELAADTGRQERVDMVDASYGDLAKTAFDGVSDFGASVLGGGVTFFDVKPEDMEAVEETIASSRKRSTRESPRTARAPSGRPLRPPYRRR